MDQAVARLIDRKRPELASRLHLPLLAKVVAISDPPQQPELSEEFRPRYAVDVQLLTEQGEVDEEFPIFRSVPLPLHYAGAERGSFAFPEPGTVVELAFAYGLPDQPFIRTVLSRGTSVPALDREESLWQQNESVRQKVDAGGHWQRETHGDIRESSLRRVLVAAELLAEYDNEHRRVGQHSVEEVAGAKIIEALGALRLLSGGSVNLSALDNLNLTTTTDINSTAARDQKTCVGNDLREQVGNIAERVARLKQVLKVEAGGTIWVGSDSTNVLRVLEELIKVVADIAQTSANHTHEYTDDGSLLKTKIPDQAGDFSGQSEDADSLMGELAPMVE
ncbi:hypothetical protein [Microbulbifer thermotolerans]|uniref:hypothetical protein n=1 Tax=Microbulbifer thermotolerans TaxID=252514 RepID=UPI00224A6131|nr:hypothetical protein [Microbulbifer thermotolerans]MCX2834444.1 phage baseplate assembly protein V [Microbulbifer thermotolerans]